MLGPLDEMFPNDDERMSEALDREALGEDDFGCDEDEFDDEELYVDDPNDELEEEW